MKKKKLTVAGAFLSIALFLAGSAFGGTENLKVTCGQDQQAGFWWNYCEYQSPSSTSGDVLYYLHGLRGSEFEWQNSPAFDKIYGSWGTSAPTVVTISYGSAWLLADKNSSGLSGLYEHFIHTALPTTETKLNLKPEHRLLMGLSMGGFNASQVYLKNPELFSKIVLACPAITTIGPYDSAEAISAYQTRTGALDANIQTALGLSAAYFPTQSDWNRAAPVVVAAQRVKSNYPPIYVSGGLQDEYGFQEGGEAFVNAVKQNGGTATWKPLPGPHCVFDVVGSALFLISN